MKKKKKKKKKVASALLKSPYFNKIMEKYKLVGRNIPIKHFYEKYVKQMDENISYRQWWYFVRSLNDKIVRKSNIILSKVVNEAVDDIAMEKNSMRKILSIADMTLDEVIENPALLSEISVQDRMTWFFNTMKARDSRAITTAKIQAEKRKTTMFEDMLQGAQYGAIEQGELVDEPEKLLLKEKIHEE